MTPEQRLTLWSKVCDDTYSGLMEYVDSLLAAERAAVAAECANVCKRLAEAMEQGAGELAPGGRLRQAENTIRDLGEPVIQQISEETMAAARRAIIRQDADKRTETEIIRDGVNFVMGEKRELPD